MATTSKSKITSPKKVVYKLLKELPENISYEDIQYHLYVLQKIDKGLEESKIGKGYTSQEMRNKLKKWIKK
jgi:hypothetical protein